MAVGLKQVRSGNTIGSEITTGKRKGKHETKRGANERKTRKTSESGKESKCR